MAPCPCVLWSHHNIQQMHINTKFLLKLIIATPGVLYITRFIRFCFDNLSKAQLYLTNTGGHRQKVSLPASKRRRIRATGSFHSSTVLPLHDIVRGVSPRRRILSTPTTMLHPYIGEGLLCVRGCP